MRAKRFRSAKAKRLSPVNAKASSTRLRGQALSVNATPAPPFQQCPAIGDDSSCGILIDVTDSGQQVLTDPSQGPYDGSDDTLTGVQNDSSSTINSLQLASSTNIFGFDGDGICSGDYSGTPAGCPFGSTGYEGPGTSFSDINADQTGGVVNFSPGIPPGGSAYFALEEPIQQATVFSGGPSTAEQGQAPNESEKSTVCSSSLPVNCATGAFWHTFDDLRVPGLGVSLDLARTYSSADAGTDGPFGYGWADTYGMSLSFDASGDATITQEDGSQITFDANGGSYVAPPWVLASFVANGDGTYTLTRDSNNVQYVFNSAGQLVSETDRNGYVTSLSYDSTGNLSTVTDQAGRTLTLTYTGNHVTGVTDPMGNETTYGYDSSGDLVSVTDPLGRTWTFTYDANHLLLSMTDPAGGTTTNTYNASSQVTQQVDPMGRTTTWAYAGDPSSASGGTTTITDPDGNQTVENYSNMELTSVTRGAGTSQAATTTYAYDPVTLGLTQVTDPNGNTTANTYDSRGDLLTTTDPLGNEKQYSYDSQGDLLSYTDPLGTTTTYAYDANGNLLSQSTPLDSSNSGTTSTTTYTYGTGSAAGEVTSSTNPDGDTTNYGYDNAGDQTSMTDALGQTSTQAYDADGRLTSVTTPGEHTTNYSYDADGELTQVTDPLGRSTTYVYDADGNRAAVTDPNGHTTSYSYNADNERTEITQSNGSTQTTTYDDDGNTTSQTDGAGDTTRYTYDPLGRVATSTDPDGHETTYTYDGAGNLLTATDPDGRTTTYSYDADNQITGITYSDGTTPNVTEAYDADGQRVSLTDGTGTSSFSYDTLGHLTSQTNGAGVTITYGYDPAENVTSITYPNGETVSRNYDADGQLKSVTDWLGNTINFTHDDDGNLATEGLPGGVTSTLSYDGAGNLTGIADNQGGTSIADFSYSRDDLGQVTSESATGAVSDSNSYSYDTNNRLTGFNSSTYSYDAANNPTGYVDGQTQAFDPAGELLTSTAAASTSGSGTGTGSGSGSGSGGSSSAHAVRIATVSTTKRVQRDGVLSTTISTQRSGQLLLAFLSSTLRSGRGKPLSPTSTGITWKKVISERRSRGVVSVWEALVSKPVSGLRVSLNGHKQLGRALLSVVAIDPGGQIGTSTTRTGKNTAPNLKINAPAGAVVLAVGHSSSAHRIQPLAANAVMSQTHARRPAAADWLQRSTNADGGQVTLGERAPKVPSWLLSAVVVEPQASEQTATLRHSESLTDDSSARSYGYNAEGDRTSIQSAGTTTTLTYDQANRLLSVSGGISYTYDGDGLRMSKTVGGTTTQFSWDESSDLPLLLQDGSTYYIYGENGQPIEQITGSTPTYLLGDQQGSTRMLLSESGSVVGTYTYDAWGNVTTHTGTTTNLQYDGQYTDAETGYQYLRARYYDPSTGQFLTRDPAAPVTRAPYSYAGDVPTAYADPSGLCLLGTNSSGGCFGGGLLREVASVTHTVSGYVSLAAWGCSAVATGTVVGLPVAGVCAVTGAVAGGLSLASGEYLYATGVESDGALLGDVAGAIPFVDGIAGSVQAGFGAYETVSAVDSPGTSSSTAGVSYGPSCTGWLSEAQSSTQAAFYLQPADAPA